MKSSAKSAIDRAKTDITSDMREATSLATIALSYWALLSLKPSCLPRSAPVVCRPPAHDLESR
jgi:hypothetical protein